MNTNNNTELLFPIKPMYEYEPICNENTSINENEEIPDIIQKCNENTSINENEEIPDIIQKCNEKLPPKTTKNVKEKTKNKKAPLKLPSIKRKSTNLCVSCGIDMGETNPRQYCGKTYCIMND
jgi:hypothetical protein